VCFVSGGVSHNGDYVREPVGDVFVAGQRLEIGW
jgi:hypothetical protein